MLNSESALLEGIIDAIADPIIIKSRKMKVLRCNKAGYRLLDEIQEKLGDATKTFIKDPASKEAFRTGKIQKTQASFKKHGYYFEKVITPLKNEAGEITSIVEQYKDISELVEKQKELDVYFSSSLDLLCIVSLEGHFLRLNPQWEEVLGYRMDELIGQEIFEYLHPDDIIPTYEAMKNLGKNKEVQNHINRYRCKDGTYRKLEWRAKPVDQKVYAVARDITEQEEGKEKLKASEEKYKTLVEQSTDMLYLHDLYGRIIEVNKATCQVMGYTREELLQMNILDLHPYQGKFESFKALWENWTRNEIIEFTTEHKTRMGKVMDVDIRARKVRFGGGEYVMALVRDVTESRKIQETLIQAKRSAESANLAKTRFLANMSHEIRTPMNGIRGFLQLLEDTPLDETQRDYVEYIENSSVNLLNIINDILDLSKIEAGEFPCDLQPMNLKETLENIAFPFEYRAKNKGLSYEIAISEKLDQEVYGDTTRLMQIVTNLITNAIKFTPKGKVQIEAEVEEKDEKHLELRFSVADSGIGLRKSDLKKVFLPFNQVDDAYTRKYGGTGLGLAIVKELLKLMGGEISVNSTYGGGSTFHVWLPFEKVNQVFCPNV